MNLHSKASHSGGSRARQPTLLNRVMACLPPIPSNSNSTLVSSPRLVAANARNIFSATRSFPGCFSLIIFYSGFPTTQISGQDFFPRTKSMLIINPNQPHGARHRDGPSPLYHPLYLDTTLLDGVAEAMGGRGQVEFKNSVYPHAPELLNLVSLYLQEASFESPGSALALTSIETMLAVAMLRHLPSNQRLRSNGYADRRSVKKAMDYMEQNYYRNMTLDEMAQTVNYSPYHFIRIFKNETGQTPSEYFLDLRIKKAAEMLKAKTHTVTEVCYACGFNNSSHFATVFKRKMGVPPSHFQTQSRRP